MKTYLFVADMLPLEIFIDQTFIQRCHQCIVVDMTRKVKLPVWFLDVPLLLELGGCFPII